MIVRRSVGSSVSPSVCPHGTTQLPLGGFLLNLIFWYFSKYCRENANFHKVTSITGSLHVDKHTFWIIYCSLFLSIKNIGDKICREIQIPFYIRFFLGGWGGCGNRNIYVVICKNIVQRGRPQIIIWRMHIACRIPKTTNTHSVCVIVTAFPLQHWFHERSSTLHYMYIVCLISRLRSKNAALFHGSFYPHYSLSHCHWGQIVCRLMSALVNKPEVQFIHTILMI
jgi:hypothetical protein